MKRLLAVSILAAASGAGANEPPIAAVEVRVGQGAVASGWRDPELAIGVSGEYAFIAEPWTSFYGEITVDQPADPTIVVSSGFRLRPHGPLRLSAGGVLMFGERAIPGGRAGIGACAGARWAELCLDLEATVYVDKGREPVDRVAADASILFGVAFPVL